MNPYNDPKALIRWAILIFIIMIVAFLLAMKIRPAHAHDHGHPENTEWMRHLASGRGPCCDGSDAVRVDDPDWVIAEDGKFTVMHDGKPETIECRRNTLNGTESDKQHGQYCVRLKVHPEDKADESTDWYMVDDSAVVSWDGNSDDPAKVGAHDGIVRVWPIIGSPYGAEITTIGIRCFMPGTGI